MAAVMGPTSISRYTFSGFNSGEDLDDGFKGILQHLTREHVELDIRNDLLEACSCAQETFSLLRIRGLQELAQVFLHATASEGCVSALQTVLNRHSATVLQLVMNAVRPLATQVEAVISRGVDGRAVTEAEQLNALKVLQVLCLVHAPSRDAVGRAGSIEVFVKRIGAGSSELSCGCLDALMAVLTDSKANLAHFQRQKGIDQICGVLKHPASSSRLKRKCAEFLSLLVTKIAGPEDSDEPTGFQTEVALILQKELGDAATAALLEDLSWSQGEVRELEGQLQEVSTAVVTSLTRNGAHIS